MLLLLAVVAQPAENSQHPYRSKYVKDTRQTSHCAFWRQRRNPTTAKQPSRVGRRFQRLWKARWLSLRPARHQELYSVPRGRHPSRRTRLPPLRQKRFWTEARVRTHEHGHHPQDNHWKEDRRSRTNLRRHGQRIHFASLATGPAPYVLERSRIGRRDAGRRRRQQRGPGVLAGNPPPA
jgi:hypothetical protein